MSEVINVLQLGTEDWNQKYQLPQNVIVHFAEVFETAPKKFYDLVFIDREIYEEEVEALFNSTRAYTLYITERIQLKGSLKELYLCKKGKIIALDEIQKFMLIEARNYFPTSYGEKFRLSNVGIAQGFLGSVVWEGNESVVVEGDFGKNLNQIVYWRNNIPIQVGQAIEFWLEYEKDPGIEIQLTITKFVQGSIGEVQKKWIFSEEALKEVVVVENEGTYGPLFISLAAKGAGRLKIIALHDRFSRRGHGSFYPGGERYVTSKREEVFCYFDPGNRKPPLNVYFSGYKTMQGFEGYYMMRKMGCPFLLIAEARLEGGGFYMGDEEYEKIIPNIIEKYKDELGFSSDDIIMSGLSMGTFGALYYGCDIRPHAMLLGKPLASIGNVAANERLHRPGGFATSLDVLHSIGDSLSDKSVMHVNSKFWDKFDKTDWSKSKFVVSYMYEDDYDSDAYDRIISHLSDNGVQVYGKGIHGRHNDATGTIVGWFVSQYKAILREDYGRETE